MARLIPLRSGDAWKIGLEAIPIERTVLTNPNRPMIAFYRGSGGYPDGLGGWCWTLLALLSTMP